MSNSQYIGFDEIVKPWKPRAGSKLSRSN